MTSIKRWLSLLMLLAAVGCGAAAPDDHDEEAEHHIPAHRPKDLAAAVEELQSRPTALNEAVAAKASDVETKFSELRDIVRWIPEIAGDSDMKKPQWDQVHAAALKLEELLPQQASQWGEVFKPGSDRERIWREQVEAVNRVQSDGVKKSFSPAG